MDAYHPLVKQLLDGEVTLAGLPPELRAEGERALRLLQAVDRTPVTLPAALEDRVMAAVREHATSAGRRGVLRWLNQPRELRVRIRPWMLAPALAAAAALVLLVAPGSRSRSLVPPPPAAAAVAVRFELYAPEATQVALAGTFNHWDQKATPLAPAAEPGVWTATLTLPVGQHQYAFVVDGERWVTDPAAPAVSDGFGRRNSVLAVAAEGARAL